MPALRFTPYSSSCILTVVESLTYRQLIQGNRNFRNLLAGQVISELGNWFNFIAGLGLVRYVSDASPVAAGIFFVCRLFPFSIVSPIAGTFVDRFLDRGAGVECKVGTGPMCVSGAFAFGRLGFSCSRRLRPRGQIAVVRPGVNGRSAQKDRYCENGKGQNSFHLIRSGKS